jgi:capsule biosynthesis phosphatase
MNIIIPIGGIGQRYKDEGYTEPKPLINVFGKPMILHLIDNLKLKNEDIIIITHNKDMNNYNFKNLLKNTYKNIIFIELNKQTEGAAETILYCLNNIDSKLLNNKCILCDCDSFYKTDILEIFRNQKNTNAVYCFKEIQSKPIYSYIIFDKNYKITDIQEKVKISNYANTGCYCFIDGKTLKKYCEIIIEKNIRYKNEFYTSCVIKEMLGDNHVFHANIIDINDYICLGTPFQLKLFCSNKNNMIEKKRFCFDLDNTLVTFPKIKGDYRTVEPITKNIKFLRNLKKMGHYIIIYTARRMKTHNSVVGKVIKDIAQITLNTLEEFEIPYDEIIFGKPQADFYIDDLAINSYDNLEKKTGYYDMIVDERNFNELKDNKMDLIIKTGNDEKIKGEIFYYKNIPSNLKKYFPIFIDNGDNWYSMEKINGITLSYLYLDKALHPEKFVYFLQIFKEIHSYDYTNLFSYNENKDEKINIYYNYSKKMKERYENYDYSKFKNSRTIYEKIITYMNDYENEEFGKCGIIHGDPVFSNCIVINDNNDFKLIDMRGKIENTSTIIGDIFYDYSKIYQSLIGYDEILLDKNMMNEYKNTMIEIFFKYICENYGKEYINHIKMITNSLLFSLIPLHNNEKCYKYFDLIDFSSTIDNL